MVAMSLALHLSGKRQTFAKRADNEQIGLLPQGMIIGMQRGSPKTGLSFGYFQIYIIQIANFS